MREAIAEARKAYAIGEVPIGCVIADENGEIIGRGFNRRNTDKNALRHCELTAIDQSCGKLGDWRLEGCSLFVTVEPCPMCAGAILQARMKAVYFGAANKKAGCCGSILNLLNNPAFNHIAEVHAGLLEEECSSLISSFFREIRGK